MRQPPAETDQTIYLVVSEMGQCHWSVRSSDGSIGGVFRRRERALEFARHEAMFFPHAVVVDESGPIGRN